MKKLHHVKEAFIATVIIIIITCIVSLIPLKNEFLKGIRQDVFGFDIYDLNYSQKNINTHNRDTNIVLVQIAETRGEIADQINLLKTYNPSVIGIDAQFGTAMDPESDAKFITAIRSAKNIVFASFLENTKGGQRISHNFYESENSRSKSGYGNFIGDNYAVIRTYAPFHKVNGIEEFSFTSRIAQAFSAEKFDTLKKRKNGQEVINYCGNIPETYTGFTKEELAVYHEAGQLKEILRNKIVLIGYFIKYNPLILDDLHFSPMNVQIAGKSFPDIYGVVIHANILSMILRNDYVRLGSETTAYIFAFLVTFLFMLYIINHHSSRAHPSHGVILLLQFLLILFILYFFVMIFNFFQWKIPLGPLMISLVLCVELLGLYQMLAVWLHKKTGYKTVFPHK